MPTTTVLGLHYPAATDPPDGAGSVYQLAVDIENKLNGSYTPYNPAFTNVAGATIVGEYQRTPGRVHFLGTANFGSSAGVGGQISMSLPVARRGSVISGRVFAIQADGTPWELVPFLNSPTSVSLLYQAAGAGSLSFTGPSAPFAWTGGAQITWDLSYAVD